MEFVGKLIQELPLEEGVSKAGNSWRKKTWIAETFDQYPKKVAMMAMNATLDNLRMEVGKVYNFSIDVESREYNGRWYTDARVYRAVETADPNGTFAPQPTAAPQPAAAPQPTNAYGAAAPQPANPFGAPAAGAPGADAFGGSDDLPF